MIENEISEHVRPQQVSSDWDAWYAAFDDRLEQYFNKWVSSDGVLTTAIGDALGAIRAQVRDESKQALVELRREFEGRLAALEARPGPRGRKGERGSRGEARR